jgi:hypothetical protein
VWRAVSVQQVYPCMKTSVHEADKWMIYRSHWFQCTIVGLIRQSHLCSGVPDFGSRRLKLRQALDGSLGLLAWRGDFRSLIGSTHFEYTELKGTLSRAVVMLYFGQDGSFSNSAC